MKKPIDPCMLYVNPFVHLSSIFGRKTNASGEMSNLGRPYFPKPAKAKKIGIKNQKSNYDAVKEMKRAVRMAQKGHFCR
jgi:hypothetical protein